MPATHRRSRSHLAITGQGAGLYSAEVCWGVLRVVLVSIQRYGDRNRHSHIQVLVPVCQLVVQCPNRPARAADAYRRAATCANREVSRHAARDWPGGLLMSTTWLRSVDESKSRSLQLLSTISRHLLLACATLRVRLAPSASAVYIAAIPLLPSCFLPPSRHPAKPHLPPDQHRFHEPNPPANENHELPLRGRHFL